ncbi:GGDEF domain-containing protein [uncultured Photobacterium sp.]|uniref:GGDEF domain-containing protein n=1 Tax=uncultured Photobacterium sp. TaxID=173973 RepID=UPI00262C1A0F|nr:GGDEF domain-containing protein [uncultured Photobacterium sp.]
MKRSAINMLRPNTLKSTFLRFLIPILAAISVILGSDWISKFCITNHDIVTITPYLLLFLAAILSYAIKQMSTGLACGLLFGTYYIIQNQLQTPLSEDTNWLKFVLLASLLPLNLLKLHLFIEKPFLSKTTLAFICSILAQLFICDLLIKNLDLSYFLTIQKPYFHTLNDLSPLPLGIIAIQVLFLAISSLVVLKRNLSSDLSLFISLLLTSLTFTFFHLNYISTVLFTLAAALLIFNLIFYSHELAFDDPLTKIPSRRALEDDLKNLGNKYTIAMLDIDFFKKFNDVYGHSTGDNVLKLIASLMSSTRGNARIYRYGGEEFTILFKGKEAHDCIEYLEELRSKIANYDLVLRDNSFRPEDECIGKEQRHSSTKNQSINITVSIGVADNFKLNTPIDVLKAADQALYQAKESGRNQVKC